MVRAVNVGMTVHARASEHTVALVGRDFVLVIQRGGVSRGHVAALTEHRHPNDEHSIVR